MNEKVLIVDDEKEFLDVIAERMDARGMDVDTATSAAEALDKVEQGSYDVVVLDLMMPEIDGLEALRRLKLKKPDIQVILLTGYATVAKGVEAIKLGAMDFIEKPADINLLEKKIKKAKNARMILLEEKTKAKIEKIIAGKSW